MTLVLCSEFCKGGRILAPYVFIRAIGIILTVILSEIIAEYNFARKNKVDNYLGFIFDVSRASKVLNLESKFIIEQLMQLQKFNFIEVYDLGLSDSCYIQVNDDNIISFKEDQERKCFNNDWDNGLLESVNPTKKVDNFSESTLKVKYYFDTHAKFSINIPVVDYLILDYYIKAYEKIEGCIFDKISDIDEYLQQCTLDDNSRHGLDKFSNFVQKVYRLAYERQKSLSDEIPPEF